MTQRQKDKQAIRSFMQAHYTDERLCALLAHAQEGKLAFESCCCFIGIATADHALQSAINPEANPAHYIQAERLDGAIEAEFAFSRFGYVRGAVQCNLRRSRILIPIVRAEMKRRAVLRQMQTAEVAA